MTGSIIDSDSVFDTESHYALYHPDKGYFMEFYERKPLTTTDVTDQHEIWKEPNRERLDCMLNEYEDWLKNFKVVKIVKNSEITYTTFSC